MGLPGFDGSLSLGLSTGGFLCGSVVFLRSTVRAHCGSVTGPHPPAKPLSVFLKGIESGIRSKGRDASGEGADFAKGLCFAGRGAPTHFALRREILQATVAFCPGPERFGGCQLGHEGIVAKRRDRPYRSGRSPDGVKVKNPNAPAAAKIMGW
jgi:hypothetical protein